MFPYWALIAPFVIGSLLAASSEEGRGVRPDRVLPLTIVLIVIMVGLRDRVGADWAAYQRMFSFAGRATWDRLIAFGDPGFMILNWLVQLVGGPLFLVNIIGAAIFAWGLYRLARLQPEPWLAVVIAIPYLVIVVAMNFARQGIALGFIMAGLASLIQRQSIPRFLVYLLLAASVHRTSIVIAPLALFGLTRGNLASVIIAVVGVGALYIALLRTHLDTLYNNYIVVAYSAQGAAIRVAMAVLPATVYLTLRKAMQLSPTETILWRNFSLAAFAALVALLTLTSSAAVDRLAIYVLPLQIVIMSRIPLVLSQVMVGRIIVIAYACAIQFVWLNYADNAKAWIPYRMVSPFS